MRFQAISRNCYSDKALFQLAGCKRCQQSQSRSWTSNTIPLKHLFAYQGNVFSGFLLHGTIELQLVFYSAHSFQSSSGSHCFLTQLVPRWLPVFTSGIFPQAPESLSTYILTHFPGALPPIRSTLFRWSWSSITSETCFNKASAGSRFLPAHEALHREHRWDSLFWITFISSLLLRGGHKTLPGTRCKDGCTEEVKQTKTQPKQLCPSLPSLLPLLFLLACTSVARTENKMTTWS